MIAPIRHPETGVFEKAQPLVGTEAFERRAEPVENMVNAVWIAVDPERLGTLDPRRHGRESVLCQIHGHVSEAHLQSIISALRRQNKPQELLR